MKYLPQLASLFGVSIDWLVGSTRYRQEGLAEVYKWNISCVEGFDPVFDFGPMFKPYRENAGISTEEMGKHVVRLLLDRIDHKHFSPVRLYLPGQLIVRDSCSRID